MIDLATAPESPIWQIAAQHGFNAILVLVLLYFGRAELREQRRELRAQKRAIDRNTKVVSIALLQFASLSPGFTPGFKEQVESIKHEVEVEEKKEAEQHEENML